MTNEIDCGYLADDERELTSVPRDNQPAGLADNQANQGNVGGQVTPIQSAEGRQERVADTLKNQGIIGKAREVHRGDVADDDSGYEGDDEGL